jgi:predicted Rossmann fold flavoprotein
LFTHFGLSGPAALDVSRAVSGSEQPRTLDLVCDFLPETKEEQLHEILGRESRAGGKRQVSTTLAQWVVHRLAEAMLLLAGIPVDRRAAELSKAERTKLMQAMKRLAIPLAGTLGFEKAEVTAGGVALEEVDSHTMRSKRVPGLFIAGELLDLDGPIGGYNFQAAFSTGWLAGQSV